MFHMQFNYKPGKYRLQRKKQKEHGESAESRVSGSSRLGACARNPLQPCRVCNFVAYADSIVYRNVNGLRVYICTFVKEKNTPTAGRGVTPPQVEKHLNDI